MDNRHICVFDFETTSTDILTTEILQIGACIVNRSNLKIIDEFEAPLIRPLHPELVEDGALKVNKITREQLMDAPLPNVVFPAFAEWIMKHNTTKGTFGSPIPAGWGIANFDMPIITRYAKEYDYWDNKWHNQNLLNPVFMFDAMHHIWAWTRRTAEPKNIKLTTVLAWMGVSEEEIEAAHNATWDVTWTAKIVIRLLRMMEWMTTDIKPETGQPRLVMKDCLK